MTAKHQSCLLSVQDRLFFPEKKDKSLCDRKFICPAYFSSILFAWVQKKVLRKAVFSPSDVGSVVVLSSFTFLT